MYSYRSYLLYSTSCQAQSSYIDIYKLNISSCLSQLFYRDQSSDAYILYIWEVDQIQYSLLFTSYRHSFYLVIAVGSLFITSVELDESKVPHKRVYEQYQLHKWITWLKWPVLLFLQKSDMLAIITYYYCFWEPCLLLQSPLP